MKIVIAGAGAVGMHLTRWLSSESHDITLIDSSDNRLQNIDSNLDAITIAGEVTDFKVLERAKVGSADLFISVTSMEEANILSCMFAKKMGARRTIARISQLQYLSNEGIELKSMGIDELISPESLAAREMRHLVKTNAASESIEFENGKITLLGLDIEEGAPAMGKTMAEISAMHTAGSYLVVAIKRGEKTIIPKGDTRVELCDHLYVITHAEGMEQLLEVTGKRKIKVDRIVIMGGSRTGIHLAKKLSRDHNVKLIERNLSKSREIASELPDVLVLNFDGTEFDKLEDEGIEATDVFLAVTGDSETNILASLVAKTRGVKKTIAMVENIEYQNLTSSIGIDSLINKKLAAANFIYRYIRRGDFISLSTIHGVDAEVVEFEVSEKSKVVNQKIRYLELPEGALIGGVIRDSKGLIPGGDFELHNGDKVVVFTKTYCARKVNRYFK
jgi:trk system potassium uptake protein TrkA